MIINLQNRVAVVTGAGRGIGRTTAEMLAKAGAYVICISKSAESCGSTAKAITESGGKALAKAVDVSSATAVNDACKQILDEVETVDILVNNAGITKDNLLIRMSDSDWDSVLATNLSSCFYFCRNLARPMSRKRWGRIVNISSVTGLAGNAGQCNYAAAKAGMIGFTQSLAREFAGRNVTANCVAPGFIETDMTNVLSEEVSARAKEQIPMKRFGTTSEIASAITFLASDYAAYITGQTLTVDGGMVM